MTDLEGLTDQAEANYIAGLEAGPQQNRMAPPGPNVGDAAPDLTLLDSSGAEVALSSFWADRPATFLFWRHFGCGCGFERAERLAEERSALAEAGTNVVLVGMGDPVRTADYVKAHQISEPFLCDPERRAYAAFGVPEGTMLQALYDDEDILLGGPEDWRMILDFKRSKGTRLVDSGWQLPGEFVVDTSGLIRMAYRYQYCDNFPDVRLLVSAVKESNAGLDPMRGSTMRPETT
ncbi:MAG: AhpC/TSA family protein [Acidimicrobiia bacterium]|nr:AhpC/TSA family protein [Acidimicrobiia bacterium]